MPNAEEVNELRYGVVGHNAFEEGALMSPAHRELVASQLYPYAVHGVFGNDECFSHNQWVAQIDVHLFACGVNGLVVQRLAALQRKAIDTKLKVVSYCIERGILVLIVAGGEDKREWE